MVPSEITVCTCYDSACAELAEISVPLMIKYCVLNGYRLVVERNIISNVVAGVNQAGNAAWNKLKVIERCIKDSRYVLWLDVDLIILRPDKLESFIEREPEVELFCLGPREFNTGVFLIRSDRFQAVIDKAFEIGYTENDAYEQDALNKAVELVGLKRTSCWIQRFLSHYVEDRTFIIHFPWGTFRPQFKTKLEAMRYFELKSSLSERGSTNV